MDNSTFTIRTVAAIHQLLKLSALTDVDVVCDMIIKTVNDIKAAYIARKNDVKAAQFRLSVFVQELAVTGSTEKETKEDGGNK